MHSQKQINEQLLAIVQNGPFYYYIQEEKGRKREGHFEIFVNRFLISA